MYSISYREFLSRHMDIREPEIYVIFENLMSDWCVGIEAVPAIAAFYWGLPGIDATRHGGDSEQLNRWFEPGPQREALNTMVKSPIIYTNVALRNWQSWKNLGVGALLNPGSYFVTSPSGLPGRFWRIPLPARPR